MKAWFVFPLFVLVGCNAGPEPTRLQLPPEDPGARIPALSHLGADWTPTWDPQSGRLVFAVHTGQRIGTTSIYPRSFSIVSYDPASPTVPTTIVSRIEGSGFRRLQFASQTGALYYLYYPGQETNGVSMELSRVPPGGGVSTVVPTPLPLGDFLISANESRLVATLQGTGERHLTDPATGDVHGALQASFVKAISPDGSEVLINEMDKVVTTTSGATRTLAWRTQLPQKVVDAAWVGGSVRLLLFEQRQSSRSTWQMSLVEWDEATGSRNILGSVETAERLATMVCAAWSPSTQSAVLLADSLTDFFNEPIRSHRSIISMADGKSTIIGSQNLEGYTFDETNTCSLSPDGKWFAYRVSYNLVYLKAVK